MTDLDLAELQTGLLHLIKGRAAPGSLADDYFQRVAASAQLQVVREIMQWWCRQTVTIEAPLTSRLLARLGRLDLATAELSRRDDLTPFRSAQAAQCLSGLRSDPNALLAALANFESQLLAVAAGAEQGPLVTEWPCDPYEALDALLGGGPLPATDDGIHFTEVSSAIPGLFRVVTTTSG
jgi:hypothetical protein